MRYEVTKLACGQWLVRNQDSQAGTFLTYETAFQYAKLLNSLASIQTKVDEINSQLKGDL